MSQNELNIDCNYSFLYYQFKKKKKKAELLYTLLNPKQGRKSTQV